MKKPHLQGALVASAVASMFLSGSALAAKTKTHKGDTATKAASAEKSCAAAKDASASKDNGCGGKNGCGGETEAAAKDGAKADASKQPAKTAAETK